LPLLLAGRKLLVADDSPYYRTVIGLTFTDEGMEVTTACDSREALEKLEQSTPDVILANVSSPEISGYELCEQIKQSERFGHIPVMLLAGLHEPFDQAEARRVGADDFVTKPFKSIRELVGRVGSLLGGKSADMEDSTRSYSTLGLERSDAVPTATPDEPAIDETNMKVFVEAQSMIEHEPSERAGEPAESTPTADVELQTATTQKLDLHAVQTAAPDEPAMDETNVKVFIEAPSMTEHEPAEPSIEPAGSTCAADVELQTANTQKLERIDDEPALDIGYAQDDTMEMEPATAVEDKFAAPAEIGLAEQPSSMNLHEKKDERAYEAAVPAAFNDALLDLGDFNSSTQIAAVDDLVLDLDYEEPNSGVAVSAPEEVREAVAAPVAPAEIVAAQPAHEEQSPAELQQSTIVSEAPAEPAPPARVFEDHGPSEPNAGLSPEAIEAIARRAVELMSEKVVREIAWEVVPELAELLIKKKLDQQN
jgi:CheY-like chemotaxis protein